jgi:hypothetical protein
LVNSSGRLLIVDFAPHERETLRAEDAHARLGFSDQQMRNWFAIGGLELDLTQTLAGGELTVKIWRGHRKTPAQLKVVAA